MTILYNNSKMGTVNITQAIIMIFCTVVFVLPLGITTIVMGATSPGKCDEKDAMGLNISQYLLGLGIANVSVAGILIFIYLFMFFEVTFIFADIASKIVATISFLYGLAWFIVGAVILYRANTDCIREASAHVIYALVLWCISALAIILHCCGHSRTKFNINKD